MKTKPPLVRAATDLLQALVSAFLDELFRRVQKQGFQLLSSILGITKKLCNSEKKAKILGRSSACLLHLVWEQNLEIR